MGTIFRSGNLMSTDHCSAAKHPVENINIDGIIIFAPQAHFDPVWGLAKWCVRRPFVTLACVSRDFVCGNLTITFSEN